MAVLMIKRSRTGQNMLTARGARRGPRPIYRNRNRPHSLTARPQCTILRSEQ